MTFRHSYIVVLLLIAVLLVQCVPSEHDVDETTDITTDTEDGTNRPVTSETETLPPPVITEGTSALDTEVESETIAENDDDVEELPSRHPDEGKAFLGDLLGFTQEAVVAELTAHEQDDFYLGTVYRPFAWRSPKGDIAYNGKEGMNCGGFVTYVALRAGMNIEAFGAAIRKSPYWFEWATESANGWYLYVRREAVQYYVFESKEELLASGLARKGDLILTWISHSTSLKNDNHIGYFWGDTPEEDRMWNSSYKRGENLIGPVEAGGRNPVWYLVPISD